MKNKESLKLYDVCLSYASDGKYRTNQTIGVVTRDIEQAIAAAKKMVSDKIDVAVWQVCYKGNVHTISIDEREQG